MVRSTTQRGPLIIAALIITLCSAQEPVVVRLRDAVGDTVDLAERDSFHLFPNTAGFHDAVILALPGPEFFAEITRTGPASAGNIFLRIMPNDLERIRFLIDNHDYVVTQQRSDSAYARALASFWQTIEDFPLRNMAGDPAIEKEISPTPTEVEPPSEPVTAEEVRPEAPGSPPASEPQTESDAAVVRLSDVVGDTIDEAERDRYHLFPYTRGFRHAVFRALPGPEYLAEVTRVDDDSVRQVYYLILPGQLERIRLLLGDRAYVPPRARANVSRSLTAFWWEVQKRPMKEAAAKAAVHDIETLPVDTTTAGGPDMQSATFENRYSYLLHGATLGSIAGGLIGSQTGFGEATACGLTVVGAYAGYRHGSRLDRGVPSSLPPKNEGSGWRICCSIGALLPGLALGAAAGTFVGAAASQGSVPWIPAVLSGLCVTVEVVTLGYQMGRSIDQNQAH